MGKIFLLAEDVRSKIAAGEVITRPNSIVKELLENSIDAGASRIEIEVEDGGKKKCLVNDDGSGMSREDVLLAVKRHATSKISSIADLERIGTYGFRGEALASIASVSQLAIETCEGGTGTVLEIRGGEVKAVRESRRSRGTRVRVSNLFFNLPVRWKFLKSSEWERRLIIDTVKSYSLARPGVAIAFEEPGRKPLKLPAVRSVEERIGLLYPGLRDNLVAIEENVDLFSVRGFFTRPDFSGRPSYTHIYVNGRPVKYPRIHRVIIEAYEQAKNLPSFVVFIETRPDFVDVNIHPAKSEVRFRDERYVADVLFRAVRKNLYSAVHRIDVDAGTAPAPAGHPGAFVQERVIPYETAEPAGFYVMKETAEFWQLHNTYILSPTKTGMIIFDQHVAHERIIYDTIVGGKAGSQRLLFPISIDLNPEEYKTYASVKDLLSDLGFEFKEFSNRTLVLDSLPPDSKMTREDLEGFFSEIKSLGELIHDRFELAKIVACKSAIKAGQRLAAAEMQSLIDRLFACDNPYTCPHGRPIIFKLSLDELAKKFGR